MRKATGKSSKRIGCRKRSSKRSYKRSYEIVLYSSCNRRVHDQLQFFGACSSQWERERIWSEQKWYALTGRVIELRAEEDGDLHIAMQDAAGDKPGIVVVELPAKPQWCE